VAMPTHEHVDLQALSDLRTPWCLHVVATLRIAEHLAAGVAGVEELAAAAGCDADVLHSVMGHLAAKGVFEETVPGRFALNEAARGLLDPAQRIGLDLEGIGGRMAHAWATLPTLVKTGRPGYPDVFGLPFWEDLAAHPEVWASFDALIGSVGHGTPSPDVPLAGGWDGVRTVVDVGGGTGAMLAEVLRARPDVRGVLVDLPATVARSAEVFDAAGVTERVTARGQSFFDALPPGADLYLLRGVLNDWPDREAAAILRRVAEAARPSGRVVVLKGLRADDAPRDVTIEMVLVGGKQRTADEFAELGRQAGLELVAAGQHLAGYSFVEFRPA